MLTTISYLWLLLVSVLQACNQNSGARTAEEIQEKVDFNNWIKKRTDFSKDDGRDPDPFLPPPRAQWSSWVVEKPCQFSQQDCPVTGVVRRFCSSGRAIDCAAPEKEIRICPKTYCPILDGYETREIACRGLGSFYTKVGSVNHSLQCRLLCTEYHQCVGFTFSQAERTCWFERYWCDQYPQLQDPASPWRVSYKKIQPANYFCGRAECDMSVELSRLFIVQTVPTMEDCSRLCNTIAQCQAFQWGPGAHQTFLEYGQNYYLNCTGFMRATCNPVMMKSAIALHCIKAANIDQLEQNTPMPKPTVLPRPVTSPRPVVPKPTVLPRPTMFPVPTMFPIPTRFP